MPSNEICSDYVLRGILIYFGLIQFSTISGEASWLSQSVYFVAPKDSQEQFPKERECSTLAFERLFLVAAGYSVNNLTPGHD